jgi:putative sterol carrier protein
VDMSHGKLNGQMAFMTGKLKLKGDMGLAMRLATLFKTVA